MLEGAAIALFNGLCRKSFPVKNLPAFSGEEIRALRKAYGKWEWISLIWLFFYAPLAGYLWFLSLRSIARFVAASHSGYVFLEFCDEMFWIFPSILLGIGSSIWLIDWTCRVMLGDRYQEFELYCHFRNGFDSNKAAIVLSILGSIGISFLVVGGLMYWDEFHEDHLVTMRPWYWNSRSYPYNKVKSIGRVSRFQAPNGNMVARAYYAIRFDGGFTWTTGQRLTESDEQHNSSIADLVATRSGKPVRPVDLIGDLKP